MPEQKPAEPAEHWEAAGATRGEELTEEPSTGLAFRLFGPVTVTREGHPIELGSPQQRRVLALLLLHRNQVVSTERLLDVLWSDELPANALQTLRVYVSRLRRALEPGPTPSPPSVLVTEPPGYKLIVAPVRVDVDRFAELLALGRAGLAARDHAAAERYLAAAFGTAQAPPLQDFEYEEFARTDRERLEELRLSATESLIEARLQLGHHGEAVGELQTLVAEHPERERPWIQLMVALYRSGRQVEALETYRKARRWLVTELGVEPGEGLRRAEQMVLLQDPALDLESAAIHGAPSYLSTFVGDRHLAEVSRRIARHRLVTLVGCGGIGKTRLATKVVPAVAHGFPDGVWWVDLVPRHPGGHVAGAVARGLGVRDVSGRSVEELIVASLRDRQVLLVLDTCEHVVENVARLVHLILAETRFAHVLATSIEPLRIASEHIYPVAPLDVPAEASAVDTALQSDGVRLLLDRANALLSETEARENVGALTEIVVRLGGVPLAIELAASRLRGMSPRELAQGLDDRFRLLVDGDRSAPPRHRTLEAVIEWSFQLLPEPEQRVLARLGIFPATFDAGAAQAVGRDEELASPAVPALLLRLVDRSLVVADVGKGMTRYRLQDTVRAFALDRAVADELTELRRRHAHHYRQLADVLASHMTGSDVMAWLARGHLEHENFLSALRWLLGEDEGDEALQLACSLGFFWYRTGYLVEGRRLLAQALDRAGPHSTWRAWGMTWFAGLVVASGDPDAVDFARRAVACCEQAGQLAPLGWALAGLAFALLAESRPEALTAAEQASKVFSELGDVEGVANCELQMGVARLQSGDTDAASVHLGSALEAFQRMRGTHAGWVLVYLAEAALARGDPEEALRWSNDAVADFRQRKDPRGLAASFVRLGRAYAQLTDTHRASALLREAAEIAQRWGYRTQAAEAGRALASLRASGTGLR